MESASRTLVCSVLFLDIVEYSKRPVAEQRQLKQAFDRVLGKALAAVAPRDRIILDTGDGAAVTFLSDPEEALLAAIAMRDAAVPAPVRIGINLGPVRLVKDRNDQLSIVGDGINVAQRVMGFSRPGQILASRSYYEVVSCLSRDYARLFRREGSRADQHAREHEIYSIEAVARATRRKAPGPLAGWLAAPGPLGLKRSAIVAAALVFLALLAAGSGLP